MPLSKQRLNRLQLIEARDGDGGGWGVSDTPFKKVRVVTTVNFSLN